MFFKYKDNLIDTLLALCLMFTIPALHMFYGVLNNSNRGAYVLITSFDKAVPFLKIFIIPYILWYPYIFMSFLYLCLTDRKTYLRILLTLDIGFVVSYIIFYFFQTTVPRPQIIGSDFLSRWVIIIYNHDNPYNCLPSIHVLTTYCMMKGVWVSSYKNKILDYMVYIIGILIILSTQFVKQHVILDAIAAIIIVEMVYSAVIHIEKIN